MSSKVEKSQIGYKNSAIKVAIVLIIFIFLIVALIISLLPLSFKLFEKRSGLNSIFNEFRRNSEFKSLRQVIESFSKDRQKFTDNTTDQGVFVADPTPVSFKWFMRKYKRGENGEDLGALHELDTANPSALGGIYDVKPLSGGGGEVAYFSGSKSSYIYIYAGINEIMNLICSGAIREII